MVYLISFFLIVVEVSLPLTANMYGVTLPFLTYLVSLKKEKEIGLGCKVIYGIEYCDKTLPGNK
jgi:hypothetical protein